MNLTQFSAKPYYPLLIDSINQICIQNGVDDSHGLGHAIQIGQETEKALASEPTIKVDDQDYEDIILAGYLHDVDDRKYFRTSGCQNAVKVLKTIKIQEESIKKIVTMIQLVSFAKNGNSILEHLPILYYLPRYLDRVEAIGLFGLYRSYIFNQERMKGAPVYLPTTPRPTSIQQAFRCAQGRDEEYMRTGMSNSIVDHFFDKLIHIKLPSNMRNPYLVELYESKLRQMAQFVVENAKNGYINYERNIIAWNQNQQKKQKPKTEQTQ